MISQIVLEMPNDMHNAEIKVAIDKPVSDLFCILSEPWWGFTGVFRSMMECRMCRLTVIEHWPEPNEKRCIQGYLGHQKLMLQRWP